MKKKENQLLGGFELQPEKVILESQVVTITAGQVTCKKNSREKEFYRFHFPEWVNIVALTAENTMLLIRQVRYGTRRMELEIPGGMVNDGEDPVVAGCRELLEETGYAGQNARIIGKVCPNPAIQYNYCYTVLVEQVVRVAAPNFDDMEDIECLPWPVDDIPQLVASGQIDHGLVLNGLMFYFSLIK